MICTASPAGQPALSRAHHISSAAGCLQVDRGPSKRICVTVRFFLDISHIQDKRESTARASWKAAWSTVRFPRCGQNVAHFRVEMLKEMRQYQASCSNAMDSMNAGMSPFGVALRFHPRAHCMHQLGSTAHDLSRRIWEAPMYGTANLSLPYQYTVNIDISGPNAWALRVSALTYAWPERPKADSQTCSATQRVHRLHRPSARAPIFLE